jgi:hypothetical protein
VQGIQTGEAVTDDTAELLARLIRAAPEKSAEAVMTAYRLGYIDGQSTMSSIAQKQMEFLLDVNLIREAGL